jgi:hypothetical protein
VPQGPAAKVGDGGRDNLDAGVDPDDDGGVVAQGVPAGWPPLTVIADHPGIAELLQPAGADEIVAHPDHRRSGQAGGGDDVGGREGRAGPRVLEHPPGIQPPHDPRRRCETEMLHGLDLSGWR